jgi:urease accessory protein UreH/urease accessory protein UreF
MASVAFKRVQTGIGRLVATADQGITRLTTVSHQAPVRWIPLKSSAVADAGAAISYMSNYGGGLLAGDHLAYNITVQESARFGLVTQGSNRIYRQRESVRHAEPSRTELHLHVEKDALLVVAPDPVTPFQTSIYRQDQYIRIDPDASICVVDWFSSGRFANGERWEQGRLVNRTELAFSDADSHVPFLIDSFCLDPSSSSKGDSSWGMDWSHVQWNAYASVLLYGDQVQAVVERCQGLQEQLASTCTSIRQSKSTASLSLSSSSEQQTASPMNLQNLSGRVLLGVSTVPSPHGKNVHVARFMATSNEDLYRVFHHCLEPMGEPFGIEFYKDRIKAGRSAAVEPTPVRQRSKPLRVDPQQEESVVSHDVNNGDQHAPKQSTLQSHATTASDDASYWAAYTLADSALPVGSFAHSTGLEAASQLGMLRGKDDLSVFVRAATRSTLQLTSPLIQASHGLVVKGLVHNSENAWLEIDRYANALLVSNAPACRASLDQGRSLLRVASKWLEESTSTSDDDDDDDGAAPSVTEQVLHKLQQEMDKSDTVGHLASTFGVVAALLNLSEDQACRLMGFCVARDIVSASVRLNLVGPMAGVKLLAQAQEAAEEGIVASQRQRDNGGNALAAAAGCSPVLDAIQPCHDLLAVRLFRT